MGARAALARTVELELWHDKLQFRDAHGDLWCIVAALGEIQGAVCMNIDQDGSHAAVFRNGELVRHFEQPDLVS